MSHTEFRYKRLRLLSELRQALSREGLADLCDTWRAVAKASRQGSTYASELRLHCLTLVFGLFALLPISILSSLRVRSYELPQQIWALGMVAIAAHGYVQMFRTRGDVTANEHGRATALMWNCAAFVFLFIIQALTELARPGTVIFPFIAYVAAAFFLRLAKHGA